MSTITSFPTLRAGVLSLGMVSGLHGCSSMVPRSTGDTMNRDAVNETVSDVVLRDVAARDGGPCPLVSFNPPAALRFRAYDIRYGGVGTTTSETTLPFGGVFLNSNLVLPVTPDNPNPTPDAASDVSMASSMAFVGLMDWDSAPFELPSTDDRVRRRRNGDPILALARPGIPSWEDAFPGAQNIGFRYTVEGRIDPTACSLRLRLLGAVNQSSGLATNQPLLALPFYAPRADGRYDIAAADFSNEAVAVFQGGLTFIIDPRTAPGMEAAMESAVLVVCDNNCPTISGSGLRRLEVVLTRRMPMNVDAGTPDATSDAPIDAAVETSIPDSGRDATPDASSDSFVDAARTDSSAEASADVRSDATDATRG